MDEKEVPVQIRKHVLKKLGKLMGRLEGEKIKEKGLAKRNKASTPSEADLELASKSKANRKPEVDSEELQEEAVDVGSPDQDDNEEDWEELLERA